ncbi:MAG: hypothetical protein WB586_26030, partial [Chthoniobacterales bacterium]
MRNVKYALNENQNALLEIAARGKAGEMPALQNAKSTANSGCATAFLSVTARDAALLTFDGDRYGIA